jgi:transposase
MAIIPQPRLFGWEQIEGLGDLERLRLVIEYMPDEELMQQLEKARGLGRDDYPIRGMWNATLAGIVFQHPSVESLIRELKRNGQLRAMCGLDKVPTSWAFSRYLRNLLGMAEEIEAIFDGLVKKIAALLPDFGENLAIDGKAIHTHANPQKKEKPADGRTTLASVCVVCSPNSRAKFK